MMQPEGWLVLLPPWVWLRTRDVWHVVYAAVVCVSFFVALIPTFQRAARLRREDPAAYSALAESSPMTRGMRRIGRLFGVGGKPRDR